MATLQNAFGYQGDNMHLPVQDLAAALPFYESVLGFRVVWRTDTPQNKAVIARDLSAKGVTRRSSANMVAHQANAAAGGPSMTPDEFDDEIGL